MTPSGNRKPDRPACSAVPQAATLAQLKNFPVFFLELMQLLIRKICQPYPEIPTDLLVKTYAARCHYCRSYLLYFQAQFIVLTPNGEFWGCVIIVFGERCNRYYISYGFIIYYVIRAYLC